MELTLQAANETDRHNDALLEAIDANDFDLCRIALTAGANPAAMTKITMDGQEHHCSILTYAIKKEKRVEFIELLIIFCNTKTCGLPTDVREHVNNLLLNTPLRLRNTIFLAMQECQNAIPKFFFKEAATDNYKKGRALFIQFLFGNTDNEYISDFFKDVAPDLSNNTCESRILIKLAADPQFANHFKINPALNMQKKSDRIQAKDNLLSHLSPIHHEELLEATSSSDSEVPVPFNN